MPTGFDNHLFSVRIDYTLSSRHTISGAYNQGSRHAVPYTSAAAPGIAQVPYIVTTLSTITGNIADVQDTFQITPHMVNQARYGFVYFGGPPVQNITGTTNPGLYGFAAAGVTGLPSGQASTNFPNLSFSGTNAPTSWVGNTPTTTNRAITYEILDNINLVKGKHSMNFGGQIQWLENNSDTADGASTPVNIAYSTDGTANVAGSSYVATTGYSYASFLLGAVTSSSDTQQAFSIVGGRFRPAAFYFQDDFKLNSKLTINAGMRWDYIPPYHEAQSRWSFLNPDIINPHHRRSRCPAVRRQIAAPAFPASAPLRSRPTGRTLSRASASPSRPMTRLFSAAATRSPTRTAAAPAARAAAASAPARPASARRSLSAIARSDRLSTSTTIPPSPPRTQPMAARDTCFRAPTP